MAVDEEFEDRLEELLRASKRADREDQQLAEALQRLVVNPDFALYLSRLLAPRIAGLGETLLQPSGSIDGCVRSEYVKGAMCGLCLARDLPSVILSTTRKQEETPDD